jgi:hypothetical protein
MVDSNTLEGKDVIIRQLQQENAGLRHKVHLTESTLDSLIAIQAAIAQNKLSDAAALIQKAISAFRGVVIS